MIRAIDYNKLTENAIIYLKIGSMVERFNIQTEDSVINGRRNANFELNNEEKAVVKWLVEEFNIEDYKTEIQTFCKEHGKKSYSKADFLKSIKRLKLTTKTAQRQPKHPDVIFYGEGEVNFSMGFRNHQLTKIVTQSSVVYDEKKRKIEECSYDATGELTSRETYKYDDGGNRVEVCTYYSNGNLCDTQKFDGHGNRTEYCKFNKDGRLFIKETAVYDYMGNQLEYRTWKGDGSLQSKETNKYDEKGHNIEHCVWVTEDLIRTKECFVYNTKGHILEKSDYNGEGIITQNIKFDSKPYCIAKKLEVTTFYEDGKPKMAKKYNLRGLLIEEHSYQPDGSVDVRKE